MIIAPEKSVLDSPESLQDVDITQLAKLPDDEELSSAKRWPCWVAAGFTRLWAGIL
jgi:hypothetical protein